MSGRRYETSIDIAAPRDRVWAVVRDLESWPQWTPTVSSVRRMTSGGDLIGSTWQIKQPGLPKSVLVIDTWNEGESFVWSSKSAGVRTTADHVLVEHGPSRTGVTLSFAMSGAGAGVMWAVLRRKIRRFVDTEAACLKTAAEGELP